MRHFVIGSPQFEAKHWEKILPFQENLTFKSIADVNCMSQRCFVQDFIDARGEDETKILVEIRS